MDATQQNLDSIVKNNLIELAFDVQNVVFGYRKSLKIINKISVQIPEGEIYALLGPNGCGKTTLTRLIIGRLKPESGSIRVFGRGQRDKNYDIPASVVGYMPQEIALFDEFTIEEILIFYGSIHKVAKNEIYQRIEHLIQTLKLPKKESKISELSGGQQRLVSLAVTLIHRPPILILDEPTVGVDPLLRSEIWIYLDKICKNEGTTVIITTHYIEEALNASTVAFMRFGILLTQTNPNLLLAEHNCKTLEEVCLKLCQQNNRRENDEKLSKIEKIPEQDNSEFSDKRIGQRKKNYQNLIDFNRTKALLLKNYLRVKRKPLIMFLFHLMPILQISLIYFSFVQKPHNLPISIYNAELKPNLSQLFIDQIDKNLLRLTYHNTKQSAFESVVNGKSWYALSFEQNFSESFQNRFLNPNDITDEDLEYSNVKVSADMSNAAIELHIGLYISNSFRDFIQNYSSSLGLNPITFSVPLSFEEPIYGSKDPLFFQFISFGITMATFHGLSMALAAVMLALERREGHLERAFVSGVKPTEILLSHMIFIFSAILSSVSLSILFQFLVFDTPSISQILDVFALLVLQCLQGMNFGLFVALIVSDMMFVGTGMACISMPTWMCSGIFWPLESIPPFLRDLFLWNPLTLPIEALRSVMMRNWSINNYQVLMGYISSIGYSTIVFLLNLVIFNRSNSIFKLS